MGDMVGSQADTVFSSAERNIAEEIRDRVNTLEGFKGVSSTNYYPGVSQYTLEIRQNSILEVQVEGRDASTVGFQDLVLSDTVIENEEVICIEREGDEVDISGGACDTVDMSDFCSDDRCAGNGVCEADQGEQCTSVDCACDPEDYPDDVDTSDVSGICGPDYVPGDYLNGTGPGTIDPLGCVSDEYVDVQAEGEQCGRNFECQGNLECNNPHPDADSDQSRCCPAGEQWNGEECENPVTYDIVYAPLNYGSGEYSTFEQQAQRTHDYLVPQTPFSECQNPDNHIRAHFLEDMSGSCPGSGRAICNECPREALNNVRDSEFGTVYDKVAGICEGNSCDTGSVCGCAMGIPAESSATNQINCGGTGPERVGTHEIGHTLGLYHIEECGAAGGCNGPNAADCNEPDRRNFVMSYCSQEYFGPAAYDHLENDVFAEALQGCQ